MSAIQESIKEMSVEELLTLITAASAEAKKKLKTVVAASAKVGKKEKKQGSMAKGVLPPQLHESFAWVDYVLADAKANGWTAYAVKGKAEHEEASEERNGMHVFPTTGKEFNRKNAMSLSKFYFSKKEGGSNEALFQKFKAQYVAPVVIPVAAVASVAASPVVSAVAASAASSAAAASPKKVKGPKAPKEVKAPKEEKAPKEVKAPKKAAKAASAEDDFLLTCPKDDAVYPWEFKGVKYGRNHKNHVYTTDENGDPLEWAGVFNGKKIDTSVPEPEDE